MNKASSLLLCVLPIFVTSCYPVMGRAWAPNQIGEPPPSRFLDASAQVLILPIWRGGDGYFLEDPVFVPAGELNSVPAMLHRPWYIGIRWYFDQYDGLYRDPRHLLLIASTGRVLLLKNHRDWLVTYEAHLGTGWRDTLLNQFASDEDLPLLVRNGDLGDFWGLVSSEAFTHDIRTCESAMKGVPDIGRLSIETCRDQRLRKEYGRSTRRRIREFITAASVSPEAGEQDHWTQVQALPLIPDY
jgi:hypothetical protein